MTTNDPLAVPDTTPGGTPRLNAALAAFNAELPEITKGKSGKVEGTTQAGKPYSYTYEYADLADINATAGPLLGKHGLAFTARPTLIGNTFCLVYELRHESGEQIDGVMPMPPSSKPQDLGKLLTYYRRYAMCAVCNIAPAGEDNDAATANNEYRLDRVATSAGAAFDNATPAQSRSRANGNGSGQQSQRQEPREQARPPVAIAPLVTDDPWRERISDIATRDEGETVYAEVTELLHDQKIDHARAQLLRAHITARVANLPKRASGQPAAPAGSALVAGGSQQPSSPAADTDGPDEATLVMEFARRIGEAKEAGDDKALASVQTDVGRARNEDRISPDIYSDLGGQVKAARQALAASGRELAGAR